jgi:hypothetical protein
MNMRLAPIEIDPRPCSLCGLTIDRHEQDDTPEGPEFFCTDVPLDELTLEELDRRAELRRQEDIAAIFSRWNEMAPAEPVEPEQPIYRTPASTVSAFRYVLGLDDPDHLTRWLAAHPADAPYLFKTWKGRRC